jgi:FtsH-binding integral membrane protein
MNNQTYQTPYVVAAAPPEERAQFIRRTYAHLAGAILAFVLLEILIFQTPLAETLTRSLLGTRMGWLLVLGGFIAISWVADKWASSTTSRGTQYLGLSLYVAAEAIIFVPLLYVAKKFSAPSVIPDAAIITALLVAGLFYTAATAKSEFSWLGGILRLGFFIALGIIVTSAIFGFDLGLLFSGAMVLLAGGSILYTTANIQRVYSPQQHVAAALALFAGIALLFWYVLQVLMSTSRR